MIALAFISLLSAQAAEPCLAAAPHAPSLDHVIVVVRNLDAAGAAFERAGFTLKPGRLHPNGLLNRHVKFRDGSGIELMTVNGRPGDGMARGYADMLAAGEGGVYLALKAQSIPPVRHAAAAAGLKLRERPYGAWTFLSFPAPSPASAVWLSTGEAGVVDPEAIVSHRPDVSGLEEVWVEGGPELGRLLAGLGGRACGEAPRSDGAPGTRWALARGSVVVVPLREDRAPRLLGAVLKLRGNAPAAKIYPHPAFWVRYR